MTMMRRFFIKRTCQYVLYMLIPLVCACLFFCTIYARQEIRALNKQGENSLEALYSQLDLVVDSIMEQENGVANNAHMTVALKKILSNDDYISYSDAVSIRSINLFLDSLVQAYDYLSSIYLYFDGYGSYFFSGKNVKNITEADENWLSIYKGMEEGTDGAARLREWTEDKGGEVLSVYRKLLIQDGVIVVNLDLGILQDSLDKMSGNDLENLYLFDQAGNLLTADAAGRVESHTPAQMQKLLEGADLGRKGGWQKIGNQYYLLQTKSYQAYQVYLVSLIPLSAVFSQMSSVILAFVIFFLLDCAVAVWLSYVTTRRNFGQIEYTLGLFEQADKGIFPEKEAASPRDEYGVILNNILHMFLNTSYLNTQLAKKQYQQQVTELLALQYQINRHFLFNTLQTVNLEVLKLSGDTGRVTRILKDLSELLKYSLSDPVRTVTVQEELHYLKEYVEIQQYRLGERFLVYYEVDEDCMEARVTRLLLQPLLENSILHGIRTSPRKGYIKLKIFRREGWMHFFVVDNGVGMSKEEMDALQERILDEGSQNIGLTNVNRRLILRYGAESSLKIAAKEGWGACLSFQIPEEKLD